MARFLSTVQRNLKVDEATSSKDDVTPGAMIGCNRRMACVARAPTCFHHTVYLLEELYEMASSGQDVPSLVDYIIKRLQHRSPVVKQKVPGGWGDKIACVNAMQAAWEIVTQHWGHPQTLRLIKYITSKRAPEFKRLMGRHAGAIRYVKGWHPASYIHASWEAHTL